MKNQITACIDGSDNSNVVCDAAAWASKVCEAPLVFLHVLEQLHPPVVEDLSGAIGLGSQELLLGELAEQDKKHNKQAIEQGKQLLESVRQRAESTGALQVSGEQRHDQLFDALLGYEDSTRLYILGRLGKSHHPEDAVLGAHVESIVRAIRTPILVAAGSFSPPSNFMLAYDGSETADKAIEKIASSPLLSGLPGHVVKVGEDTPEHRQCLEKACGILRSNGHQVQSHLLQGNVIDCLMDFQNRFSIEMTVMGAYGHSRIREFILGSNTTKILAASTVPVLILR